jgi:hypothetical protein
LFPADLAIRVDGSDAGSFHMRCEFSRALRGARGLSLLAGAAIMALMATAGSALGQGTSAFTYQGVLKDGGTAANGLYDLRFTLYGSSGGADQIGLPVCLDNVLVVDGLFTVVLNFGSGAFDGAARHLEIEVRQDTALTCLSPAGFTTLGSRQFLRPAPYASYASEARNADLLASWPATSYARTDIAETFLEPIFIQDPDQLLLTLQSTGSTGSALRLQSDSSARSFDLISTGGSSPEGGDRFVIKDATSGNATLTIEGGGAGFVGIGTTNPSRLLDVRDGSIRVATDAAGEGAAEMSVTSNEHGLLTIRAQTGNFYIWAGESQASGAADVGGQLLVGNAAGAARGGFQVLSNGNCNMFAQVKNFVVANPDDPSTEIYYACVEGPEAAMYTRGTGQLIGGRAIVTLPRHFTAMAAAEGITVQITPLSADCFGMAVVNKGVAGFEVRELMRGTSNAAFDWEVKAVRKGYEDYEVVRPAGLLNPRPVGESAAAAR